MKYLGKCFLSWVLCMVMLLSTISVCATDTKKLEVNEEWISIVNPRYSDVLDKEAELEELEIIQGCVDKTATRVSRDRLAVFDTGEQATLYIREQMVLREGEITLLLPYEQLAYIQDIVNAAWVHTEECAGTEGDALAWGGGKLLAINAVAILLIICL